MSETQPGELSVVERAARRVGELANETVPGKRLQSRLLRRATTPCIRLAVGPRVFTHGLAQLLALRPERGVLLAANHRSFFDLWVGMLPLFAAHPPPPWLRQVCFPVRAEFFYDSPLGLLLNLTLGGCCMYPPVYRDASRSALNEQALSRIRSFLARPGHAVGFHPEGRRSRGADPYELLPAQPGVGQIVLQAEPVVIPVFINGLTNNLLAEVRKTRTRDSRFSDPIVVVYGAPLDYRSFRQQRPRLALYKRLADRVCEAILDCATIERELRAAILARDTSAADGWLLNQG